MSTNHQNPGSSLGNVIVNRRETASDVQDLQELKQLLPSSIIGEPQQDVKIDIEPKVEAEVTPWISRNERSDGIKEFRISNCTESSFVLKFFESPEITDELVDLDSILSVKFQILSNFDGTEMNKLAELINKCSKKAVIVQLVSKSGEKSTIFWKSKEIPQLLKVKPISNVELDQIRNFNNFAAEFLTDALKNGQSGLGSSFVLKPDVMEVEVNFLADSRDFNLLLQACEKGNVNVVRTGLALGMNTTLQSSKVTAQSLALQHGRYDIVLALTEANLTFPKSFDIKKSPEEFRTVYKIIEMLHEHVKANNVAKVKEILLENPRKWYFYNFRNESAIKVALKNESMETYELLLSHKLRFGPHENSEVLLQELSVQNKRVAREIHNRHAQDSPMKHINILMANSFICHDVEDAEAKMKYVNRAYRALNTNLFIRMLLMIVAASKKFKIIFDFNRDSVSAADPTVDANTQGLFYLSGRIYVGAKQLLDQATEHETLATMVHELCHYVMNIVYKNEAKPYPANDNLTMQEFEKVSEKCKQLLGAEDVIDLVYECYPPEAHHAELIVRVVHLLALYRNQPKKLEEVRETYSDLFEFHEKKIHPQLEKALPEIEAKAEKESDEKDDLLFKYKFLLIFGGILSAILMVIGFFVLKHFFFPNYVFVELSESNKNEVRNALINYKGVDLTFIDLFAKDSDAYNKLTSDDIQNMFSMRSLNLSEVRLGFLNNFIDHKWENLTIKLKEKVLSSNFTFQNESLRLELLNETVTQVLNSLTSEQIVDVLDGKELKVGEMIADEIKFYIERKVVDEDAYAIMYQCRREKRYSECTDSLCFKEYLRKFSDDEKLLEIKNNEDFKKNIHDYKNYVHKNTEVHLNFSQIFEEAMNEKIFILSAEAGTGKTVTFEQLTIEMKKMFPMRWVSYIDLKNFIKFYNSSGILEDFRSLLENILRLGPRNEFERKTFWELYMSGDVVLFWNGFDEISPDFNEFILKALSIIRQNSTNTQFVCTRPLYSYQLKKELKFHTYTLVPFTKSEQSEFLEKFFISEEEPEEKIEGYIGKIDNITTKLKDKRDFREFDSPLMLVMLATIISNDSQIYESENIYQIYEKFINIKIDKWQKTELGSKYVKGALGKMFTMLDVFLKYSLKSNARNIFHLPKLKLIRTKVPKELTNDEISRTGILYINGPTNYQFAHKTFEEYFFAKFLLNSIYNEEIEHTDDDGGAVLRILYSVISRYGRFPVILKFLNSYLETQETPKKINPKIAELLNTKEKWIFSEFLVNGNDVQWQILLNFLKGDKKVLTSLLNANEDETYYTALFSPINREGSLDSHLKLKKFAQNLLEDKSKFEKFINGKNQRGKILFYEFYWYVNKNKEIKHDSYNLDSEILKSKNYSLFFESVVKNLTEPEFDELFLSKTSFIYFFSKDLLQKKDYKKYEIIEKFLMEKGKYKSFLMNMYEVIMKYEVNDINFKPYFELPKKAVEIIKSDIFYLFSTKGLLIYAVDSETFEQFWNFLKEHTNELQQKHLLSQEIPVTLPHIKLPESNVFLLEMAKDKKEHKFILNLYKENFSMSKLQKMILKSNEFLYYMFYVYYRTSTEEKLEYLREIFTGNESELYEFLTTQEINSIKMNLVDYVKEYGNDWLLGILTKYLNELKANILIK